VQALLNIRRDISFREQFLRAREPRIQLTLRPWPFIGAQMSEFVADREQRSVEPHARIGPSFYPYFDSEDRFRTSGHAHGNETYLVKIAIAP